VVERQLPKLNVVGSIPIARSRLSRKVAACAVIGVPDAEWGERVHAVVVLKPAPRPRRMISGAHCKGLIGGYKCLRSVDFVPAMPMCASRTGRPAAAGGVTGR
jgi:acyl-CoA synthetase (AMP-forming)/AMP-acid ligase II